MQPPKSLDAWANISSMVMAIVATLTLGFGYYQVRRAVLDTRATLQMQRDAMANEREMKAIELIVRYNDLMREPTHSGADVRNWRENLSVVLAESVFDLTRGDSAWLQTVDWMLRQHLPFLQSGLDCGTYDSAFVAFATRVAGRSVCR